MYFCTFLFIKPFFILKRPIFWYITSSTAKEHDSLRDIAHAQERSLTTSVCVLLLLGVLISTLHYSTMYVPTPSHDTLTWYTKYRIPSTEYRVTNTEYRIPSTEYRIPNTEYQVPNTEYRIPRPREVLLYSTLPTLRCMYLNGRNN